MFKAERLKDYDETMFRPGYASIKRNGIHGIYTRADKIFSRTPNQLKGLEHLYEGLNRCPVPLVFEIVIPDVDFETCSGTIRNFEPAPTAEVHIFNMVIPGMPFKSRLTQMLRYRDLVAKDYPQIHVEEMHLVGSKEEFDDFYNTAVAAGEEGVCLILPDHVYEPGARRWTWMKRVPHKSIELEIIDLLPGDRGKKYQNTLGRMLCKMADGNEVKVGIFKGQTDLWREKIWLNKEEYIGQKITVIFKTYSKYGVPVQPRFVGFAWEKE